jgi:pimeloyl-ACP methyl ester carboxylesterase
MGGMISQRMAATAPDRVISLTSIMSSSGAPGLPGPRADISHAMMQRPASLSPADIATNTMALLERIGSPAFQQDRDHLYQRLVAGVQRNHDPQGMVRQMLAVMADTDRHTVLERITCPTLVIHGTADPLVPLACGEDTARRIAGARFEAIEGMGHDWPPAVVPRWLDLVVPHLRAADAL